MARSLTIAESLKTLLDGSSRPVYVVDAQRRIVYCNPALAAWLDLEPKRIAGRRVEFHSEEPKTEQAKRSETAPLTDLCPPPSALAGEASTGTISCQSRAGHMRHRAAEFVPLGHIGKAIPRAGKAAVETAVIVLLAEEDLSPQEVAAGVAGGETTDELHRTIRRFRRRQAQRYSIYSLLGTSSALQKVRAQVAAAGASGAHALVLGRRGSGRSHIARAIHYAGATEDSLLLPIDCEVLTDDIWTRTLDKLRPSQMAASARPTLLIEHLDRLAAEHQAVLLAALRQSALNARIVATCDPGLAPAEPEDVEEGPINAPKFEHESPEPRCNPVTTVAPALFDAISTMTIRVPSLADRLEDLPLLAQFFLESCNRGNEKQVGSLRRDALDSLALYSWPGELDQLREMIEQAHAAATSHEITAANLPTTIFHAVRAASHAGRQPRPILLDELLADFEKQAIVRALAQTGGNKSEAAVLLGMTRPRLYRRLVQLGLAAEEPEAIDSASSPEFIEQEASEPSE